MIRHCIAFVLVFCSNTLLSQNRLEIRKSLNIRDVHYFDVDQFSNLYVINNDELKKLDPAGKMIYSYSNPIFGIPETVSAFNALNPQLFYPDLNEIVVLDNRLNEERSLNLVQSGTFLDVSLVDISDQETIWLYDQATDRIYRYNFSDLKVRNQSLNITQITGMENRPNKLISTFDRVYLNIPEKGILIFDATGSYIRYIPLLNAIDIAVYDQTIMALANGKLYRYDLRTFERQELEVELEGIRNIRIMEKVIYFLNEDGIHLGDL